MNFMRSSQKCSPKKRENGDLMRVYGGLMEFNGIYPLVNVYITNWKITMLLIGKSTILIRALFNSKL